MSETTRPATGLVRRPRDRGRSSDDSMAVTLDNTDMDGLCEDRDIMEGVESELLVHTSVCGPKAMTLTEALLNDFDDDDPVRRVLFVRLDRYEGQGPRDTTVDETEVHERLSKVIENGRLDRDLAKLFEGTWETDPGLVAARSLLSNSGLQSTRPRFVSFEDHVWSAYDRYVGTPRAYAGPESLFTGHRSISLRRDEINRVLVYYGTFNPPHVGHYGHINHIFNKAQHLLNLVACFTQPRNKNFLKRKFRQRPDVTVLPRLDRVKLFRHHTPSLPWNCVFDGSDKQFHAIRAEVKRTLAAEGFQIQFLNVVGPDYVTVAKGPGSDGCYITSNLFIKADFVGTKGRLTQIAGCDEWKNFRFDKKDKLERARPPGAKISPPITTVLMRILEGKAIAVQNDEETHNLATSLLSGMTQQTNRIKVCRCIDNPDSVVYFVPKHPRTRAKEFSSTKLRALIDSVRAGDEVEATLMKKLEGIALSPAELIKLVMAAAEKQ